MKERVYIDRLFADYENSPEIKDFKEEVLSNLNERIKELMTNGLNEDEAFDKASLELGDITAIADEVGKTKRIEAIGQMYMRAKVPLTKRTAAGITVASGLLLLGVGLGLIAFFGEMGSWMYNLLVILLALACGLYIFIGLTQESAAHYAMKQSRAFAYGAVGVFGFLGAGLSVVSFLVEGIEMSAALVIKMTLILPALCALIFLLATEPKRHKPWLKALIEHDIGSSTRYSEIINPAKAATFGITSVGLWILALACFIALGFIIGWQYSWLVFLFALAIQVFLLTTIFDRHATPRH